MTLSRSKILLLALLPLSFAARAEWSYVGPLPAGGDVYVDLHSRTRTSDVSRISLLGNYAAPHAEQDGAPIRSSTSMQEFDCAGRRTRLVERQVHDAPFAQGASRVSNVGEQPWKPVPAGSRGESLMTVACSASTLVSSPTRDWKALPLVPGSTNLRHDPAHTQRQGTHLQLRWLMEQGPDDLKPPAGHAAASTEVDMSIACDRRRILSFTGIGRAEPSGRGTAATVSANAQENPVEGLPAPLAALVLQLCQAH